MLMIKIVFFQCLLGLIKHKNINKHNKIEKSDEAVSEILQVHSVPLQLIWLINFKQNINAYLKRIIL